MIACIIKDFRLLEAFSLINWRNDCCSKSDLTNWVFIYEFHNIFNHLMCKNLSLGVETSLNKQQQ